MKRLSRFDLLRVAAAFVGWFACNVVVIADEQTTDGAAQYGDYTRDPGAETSSIGRSENVESKLSSEFADFLGSEEKASRVVQGLRTGDEFRLDGRHHADGRVTHHGAMDYSGQPAGGGRHLHTIDPPTGTMGYGNVRLTLSLAEARLAKMGISQPNNRELSAILVGGEIHGVQVEGILNERAAGAGWGEIAQRYDLKVGQIMGKADTAKTVTVQPHNAGPYSRDTTGGRSLRASEKTATAAPNIHSARHSVRGNGYIPSGKADVRSGSAVYESQGAGNQKRAALRNGYIPSGSSSVTTAGNHSNAGAAGLKGSHTEKNGYIPSGKDYARGVGIVSASGGGIGGQSDLKSGHAKGHVKGYLPSSAGSNSAGIVSAANASRSATVSSAGGRGHANGRGKHK